MSLVRNHTGFHFYPLSAGSNDNPTFSQTSPTSFELKNIPICVGDLPYYVYGVLLTFYGDVDQPASGGSALNYNQLRQALIDSLEVRNAWHGTPISANHVKGTMLPIIEAVGGGYCTPQVTPGPMQATDGDRAFEISVFVPLCIGNGAKPHHSAQLALFYKQAQLVINPAAASILAGFSTGSAFEALTVRASAVMLPEPELRLGPVAEWIDYQSSASSNQTQIALDSFGNVTGLAGTIPNAGVMWMGALTNVDGLPGSFALENVTRYSFPFRGQVDIMQMQAFVAMQLYSMGGDFAARAAQAQLANLSGQAAVAFPYSISNTLSGTSAMQQLARMLFLPMITPAVDLELTKVQTAKGTQSYFVTGPTFSGTNHTLAQHVRSFDDRKREDAVRQIVDSGLAKQVLGRTTGLGWVPKLEKKNDTIDPEKLRYLPFRLVREEPKPVVSPQALTAQVRRMGGGFR
jgi:hypothetical protein